MILAPLFGFAQQPNSKIQELWKSIETKEANQEMKSLLPEVQEVIILSKKAKDYPSVLKAMFYEAKINITTKEEKEYDVNSILTQFENEAKNAKGEYKAIIESYLAHLYSLYYDANRYLINGRTKLENQKSQDVRFWTKADFEKNIKLKFEEAIALAKKTPTAKVGEWNDVFQTIENFKIDFGKFSIADALQLDYATYLMSYGWIGDEGENTSKQNQAKKLIDDVIDRLQKSEQNELAAYTTIYALQLFPSTTNFAKENKTYQDLVAKYPNSSLVYEGTAQYLYRVYLQQSADEKINETIGGTLIGFIDKAVEKFPNTDISKRLIDIKNEVQAPSLNMNSEFYVLPDISNILTLTYKNSPTIYIKVVKYTSDDKDFNITVPNTLEGYQQIASAYEKVLDYSIALKPFTDYKGHSTQVELKPLKAGRYIVLISNKEFDEVKDGKDIITMSTVNVTNSGFVQKENKFRLYDRSTGKTKANTTVILTNGPKKQMTKGYWETSIQTDANGEFTVDFPTDVSRLYYGVKGEQVFYSTYVSRNRIADDTTENEAYVTAKIITDRAIYRPGQVIYFKAILASEKVKIKQVVPNQEIIVTLYNANGEDVSEIKAKTNAFGSIQGEFIIPTNGLLGNYHLEVKYKGEEINSYYDISVEEYKRPKFEVTMDAVKNIFKFNEEVTVKGKALDFSGATVGGAKVKYRVERYSGYQYRVNGYYGWPNYRDKVTISDGEVTTNNAGDFNIKFKAIPQRESYDADNLRIDSYVVYIDVTDISGETQSITQTIFVGDRNIQLQLPLSVATTVTNNQLEKIAVKTTNLNKEPFAAKGEINIYEVESPYPLRMLLSGTGYSSVDYELYSYNEFVALFPYTAYGDEANVTKWKEGKRVFSKSFDTAKENEVAFPEARKLKSGNYLVKAWVYEDGNKIEVSHSFYYDNTKEEPGIIYKLLTTKADKDTYKKGDVAKIRLQSGENNTIVIASVFVNGYLKQKKQLEVNRKASYFELPITDNQQVNVSFIAVKHNAIVKNDVNLKTIDNADDLKIELGTFRDKITPGQKETWSLKVSGENKDKVLAEVVAGMYDASLDQFQRNLSYTTGFRGDYFAMGNDTDFYTYNFNQTTYARHLLAISNSATFQNFSNPVALNLYGFSFSYGRNMVVRGMTTLNKSSNNITGTFGAAPSSGESINNSYDFFNSDSDKNTKSEVVFTGYEPEAKRIKEDDLIAEPVIQLRKNLQETAFFYPMLQTDEKGNVSFSFTAPEALTQWRFSAFAHTKELKNAYVEQLIQTHKELMITPNMPRFVREDDHITIAAKVANLSDKNLNGVAELTFFNLLTNEPLQILSKETNGSQNFSLDKDGNAVVSWVIDIPKNIEALGYRIIAKAGSFSDGEEGAIPVLANRMLVTETMPLYVKEGQNKLFNFTALENRKSATLENFKLTLELTTNPAWTAIMALPSIKESQYTSTDQTFAKVFANTIAANLINSNPSIKQVFDYWSKQGEITSKLEQNQELKNVLIAETPWVREAADETEQMKRLAVLFDLNKMRTEYQAELNRLGDSQNQDGGFPWYVGGTSDVYITQSIVEGFGTMKNMGALAMSSTEADILKKAIAYLDEQHFINYQKSKTKEASVLDVHYLYVRSMFKDEVKVQDKYTSMLASFRKELAESKPSDDLFSTAMKAIILQKFGETKTAQTYVKSIMEKSVESDEMGMYWKENQAGWLWYNAPIETQVMIMEAANAVDATKYANAIEEMKVWLLKNKQTNSWRSSKATTQAVYALMRLGKNWVTSDQKIEVKVGGYPISFTKSEQVSAGYYKKMWSGDEIKDKMGVVELDKPSAGIAYGGMYWQYFEDLNKIKGSGSSAIQFNKQLFVKTNTASGQVLRAISNKTPIKVGDVVTIRLEITIDRDMEFVQLKDMRASGFEPINVMSGYKYHNGLSYYEETRDTATNFFITYLRKGSYVFEYDVRANNAGYFSNGITTLQSVYAPEMNANSFGEDVKILNN